MPYRHGFGVQHLGWCPIVSLLQRGDGYCCGWLGHLGFVVWFCFPWRTVGGNSSSTIWRIMLRLGWSSIGHPLATPVNSEPFNAGFQATTPPSLDDAIGTYGGLGVVIRVLPRSPLSLENPSSYATITQVDFSWYICINNENCRRQQSDGMHEFAIPLFQQYVYMTSSRPTITGEKARLWIL